MGPNRTKWDLTLLRDTECKFEDFSITQILREIDFGILEVQKLPFFAILEAVNFVNLVNFSLPKIHKNQNSEPLNVIKRWILIPKMITQK